jgi:hypothetical protein
MNPNVKENEIRNEFQKTFKNTDNPDEKARLQQEYFTKLAELFHEKITWAENNTKQLNVENKNIHYNLAYNRIGCMKIQKDEKCSKCGTITKVVGFGEDEYGVGYACKACIITLFDT